MRKAMNCCNAKKMFFYELYRPEACKHTGSGWALLKNNRINKDLAFSSSERRMLGIEGLMPQGKRTQQEQAQKIMDQLRQQSNDMAKFILLETLRERNEKLFFHLLHNYLSELMPIVYTPTVGEACTNFEYRCPKYTWALFINIEEHNSVNSICHILSNWRSEDIRAIVVTDGERILGLGDLGIGGVEIPVGKLALYVALGGIQPQWCLPVQLDVGTDNQELRDNPAYLGLRQPRVKGPDYDRFIDNFLISCRKKFGKQILVQFEDFGRGNAERLLERYKDQYCTFDDDIQGTASVAVAGLLAAIRITGQKLSEQKFLFHGAGMAGIGIAELLVYQMQMEGLSPDQACDRIFLVKSDGLVTKSRDNLRDNQIQFAKDMEDLKELGDVVKAVKPTAVIGVSTIGGAFTDSIIKDMASFNERPIIFALSNPTDKSECTAEAAYHGTNGTALFASGSPFSEVQFGPNTLKPGQCNNAYIFPGIALGAVLFKLTKIPEKLFLIAAKKLAEFVTDEDLRVGCLYPDLEKVPEISIQIAVAIADECYRDQLAQLLPEPEDKDQFVRSQLYNTDYEDVHIEEDECEEAQKHSPESIAKFAYSMPIQQQR